MDKKIIWVFGPTAVGKKTMIIDGTKPNSFLRKMFNLEYENYIPIVVYNSRKIAINNMDENIRDRLSFLESVFKSELDCNIGISGQYIDIPNNLKILKEKYPNKMNYCIYLHINIDDYEYRIKERKGKHIGDIKNRYKKAYRRMEKDLIFLNEIFDNVIIANNNE